METMVLRPQDSLAQERHRYQSGAMAGVMYSYGGLPRTKRQQKAAAQVFASVPLLAENSFMQQQQARPGLKAPQYRLHSTPAVGAVPSDSPLLPSFKQQHQFAASLTTPARNGSSAAPRHISRTRSDGELQTLKKQTIAVEKGERRKPSEKNADIARNVSEKNQERLERRKCGSEKKGTEKKGAAMSNMHDLSRQTAPRKPVVVTILQRPQTKEAVAEHLAKFANRSDESVQPSSHQPIQSALTKMIADEAVRDAKGGVPDLIAAPKSGEVDWKHAEKSNNTSPKKLRLGRKKSGVKPVPASAIGDEDVPDSSGDVPEDAKGGELARTHSGPTVSKVPQKKITMFIKKASGEARGKTLVAHGDEGEESVCVADLSGESENKNSGNASITSAKETSLIERKKANREFTGNAKSVPEASVEEMRQQLLGVVSDTVACIRGLVRGGEPAVFERKQNVQNVHGGLSRSLSKSVEVVPHDGVGGSLSHSKSVGSVPSIAEGDLSQILGNSPDKTFERWAGPAYINSPPPSTLPFPKFSIHRVSSLLTDVALQRVNSLLTAASELAASELDSACPQDTYSPSSGRLSPSSIPSTDSLFSAKQPHVLDPTSATKDLRRMLNLDLDWSDDESLESVMVSNDSFSDLATQGLKRMLQLS